MPKDDLVYIGHMLDTARQVASKIAGNSRADFDADENCRLAITYLIQTIGESARRVSRDYQQAHPQIPWRGVVGMRHKVVHDYFEVDFSIVWGVATVELPALAADLEKLLPPELLYPPA